MYKHLFFDDRYVFVRDNVKRSYGEPELVEDAIYCDDASSQAWPGCWIFPKADGGWRMLYMAGYELGQKKGFFSAVSEDGVHFQPEELYSEIPENLISKNQIMQLPFGEIAAIIEDPYDVPERRYKMLFDAIEVETVTLIGELYTSPDLFHWNKEEGVRWSKDGEPVTGVLYNKKKQCYVIICRPAWGVRMLGYIETKDWKTFTEYKHCMQTDALDAPLEEIYGMLPFAYGNMYIGMTLIYGGFENCMSAKYKSGTIKAQLSYSYDGNYWLRSLREPFLSGVSPDKTARDCMQFPMLWPMSVLEKGDDFYIFANAALKEHGPAFHTPGHNGRGIVYKLRKDGFIKIESEDKTKESTFATRENVWHGGDVHFNLKAEKATVAVYRSDVAEDMGMNILGECNVVEGFSHEDCIPFSGDCCDWVPQFKSGRTMDELTDGVVAFEIKFTNGEIYSISGDMTPVFNAEGEQWRKTKRLPYYL